jgi:hypothetical protein
MPRAGLVASTSENCTLSRAQVGPDSPHSARNNAGPLVGHLGGRALRDACALQRIWSMELELGVRTAQA